MLLRYDGVCTRNRKESSQKLDANNSLPLIIDFETTKQYIWRFYFDSITSERFILE